MTALVGKRQTRRSLPGRWEALHVCAASCNDVRIQWPLRCFGATGLPGSSAATLSNRSIPVEELPRVGALNPSLAADQPACQPVGSVPVKTAR
jgi:hypothetical protein